VPVPHLHPDMQVLLDAREAARPGDLEDARRRWREYTARLSRPAPAGLQVKDRDVAVAHRSVRVRLYGHRDSAAPRPWLLYIHGGGFVKGDLDTSHAIAWGYAQDTGAVVVSVDHRLAPEHPWPAPLDDCHDVLLAVVRQPLAFGVDPHRVAVAGESSGGFLAAALAIRLRDEGGPRLAAQVIVGSGGGTPAGSRSRQEFGSGVPAGARELDAFYEALFAGRDPRTLPYAWPIDHPDLRGLPPAWVHAAEIDPTRDDARAYAARLARVGNDVVYREARGMLNGFLRARFTGAAARREYEAVCGFLRARLQNCAR